MPDASVGSTALVVVVASVVVVLGTNSLQASIELRCSFRASDLHTASSFSSMSELNRAVFSFSLPPAVLGITNSKAELQHLLLVASSSAVKSMQQNPPRSDLWQNSCV